MKQTTQIQLSFGDHQSLVISNYSTVRISSDTTLQFHTPTPAFPMHKMSSLSSNPGCIYSRTNKHSADADSSHVSKFLELTEY